ncbi:leucyl/phenylalanyl-tRNA--protein transferase [Bacteroidia bacterium]|nr:leucyl/phenylalanyl-tRNA--protein transferase [Bacteroidia bacterium]
MLLTPEILIQAYASGAFPMADPEEDNQIYWHTPQMRGVIPLDDRFKVSKNLKRLYKKDKFDLYINRNFDQVIDYCRSLREDDTWISDEILDAYKQLHEGGFAHSFEVYEEGKLVGGLYGVSIGKAFFGESMFHLVTDASKIALVFLVEFLKEHDFLLLDTQYLNPHIAQFGAFEITHQEYVKILRRAIAAS